LRSTPYPAAAEQDWARRVVDELHLPYRTDIAGLLALVGRRVGRPLLVVPTDEPVVNGALEHWPGAALAIRVTRYATGAHRTHLICRGAARALYREPGDRDGTPDHRSPIEREIECAAMALARHISPSPHHGHIR
jgi:hypothetical protein